MNSTGKILLALMHAAIVLAAGAGEPDLSLENRIGGRGELFRTLDARTFLNGPDPVWRQYFRWTSVKADEARYPAHSNAQKLLFRGRPAAEVLFSFQAGKLNRITVSAYNRGDCGPMHPDAFAELRGSLETYFTDLTGKPGVESRKNVGKSVQRRKTWQWTGDLQVVLRYSSTGTGKRSVPEYLQITYEKNGNAGPQTQTRAAASGTVVSPAGLLKNVKRDAGSVYIDNIPMVDQGPKGYCAVAVAERLMRYYGNQQVSQHTVAQIAQTSAASGTQRRNMVKAMREIAGRYGCRFSVRYDTDLNSVKNINRYLKQYNSMAKKMKKPKIAPVIRGRVIYMDETLAQTDADVLRALRLADRSGMMQFVREIKANTGKGVPLIWAVTLGIVKEPCIPQQRGGHMRLIIGYNEAEKTVYFSDTWGRGHEKKQMSMEDAWVMTNSLMTLEPREQSFRSPR